MQTKNTITKISKYAASASALLLGTQVDAAIVTNDIADVCWEPMTENESIAFDIDGDGANDVGFFAYDPAFDDVYIIMQGLGGAIGTEGDQTTTMYPGLGDVDFDCETGNTNSSGGIHTLGVGVHGFAPVLFNIGGTQHFGVVELTTVGGEGSQADDVRKVIVHSFTYNDDSDDCFVAAALPVDLAKFDAYGVDNRIVLEWSTNSEVNNQGFEVQRSIDGKSWKSIGFESGVGTTHEISNYTWVDKEPVGPNAYYRLKQINFNGEEEYSQVLSVSFSNAVSKFELSVFPNPTSDHLLYNLPDENLNVHEISLWTTDGKRVVSKTIQDQGVKVMNLQGIETGTYIFNVKSKGKNYSKIIVKK